MKKRTSFNPPVFILIGPPGSGKGTQAFILTERFPGLFYFETSRIIEENVMHAKPQDHVRIGKKKYFLQHERNLWKSGILCTPEVVSFWVNEKFRELASQKRGLVIAGSPRTLYEGKEVMPVLEKLYGKKYIVILELALETEASIWRNSHRRLCALFRHPILYSRETKMLKHCPLDGSKLLVRKGLDDPQTIQVRVREYHERTRPLLAFFRARGYRTKRINGAQLPERVADDIARALKGLV